MNWNENKESGPITDSQLQGLLDDYIKVCNNLAAAFIEIGSYNTALENVDKVLKYQPKNLKALFRKGKKFCLNFLLLFCLFFLIC